MGVGFRLPLKFLYDGFGGVDQMPTMEISVIPLGTGKTSASEYIAECIRKAQELGVSYELTAMGTNLEGDLEMLFQVARAMHEAPFAKGVQRVYTVIKIDDRRDQPSTLQSKVQSVQEKLSPLG